MKFAAQVFLFLSSSFAFVKGQVVTCTDWPCPDDTETIFFDYNFVGTIPTEIGQLNQLTWLEICTCFGGCSIVFGSTITFLTSHVWLNCASPRHDRWQSFLFTDRKHPVGDRTVNCFDSSSFEYVFRGGSNFFGSTITFLTTHVWLNCASPRLDREQ